MLVRVAACAAFVFVWPIGTHVAEDDGALPLPEIVIEIGRQPADAAQRNDTGAENQASLPESDDVASAAERLQPETNPPFASKSAFAFEPEPFGLGAEPVMDGEILAKWGGVEAQIKVENRVLARCRSGGSWCPRAARRFLAIVNVGRTLTGRARIGVINREINLSIVPTSDLAQWGVADRWSAPLETFTTRRGDCEDYAIAKYVALRDAGVAPEDVRLVVVRNTEDEENHAVVAVRLDGDWLILDNRWLALVRDREMRRAIPLFELDENGVRRFVDPAPAAKLQASSGSS
ncbi:MAG TPA: transglutaminase-like cysteine peptidase [Xanthobacteraceae bacterium]|nr:transglutaminase-like cysteine peptidase [Xanthobacteraceae bacterium]